MRASKFVTRHNGVILAVALLLVIPSLIGIKNTGIEFNVLNYLPANLESMRGEIIIDKEFGDASTALLMIENKPPRASLDLERRIASIEGVSGVVGVDDIVDPTIPREVLPAEIRERFSSDKGSLLLIRFAESSGSPKTESAVLAIRAILDKDCYLSCTTAANIDGRDLSNAEMPVYLCLAVAFVILILGLTMGSWIIPFIFLVEIGLAIVYNLGTNVFLGKISYITQSLAAVLQLGVTMDFSIFLLHRYEEERRTIPDKRDAMASAIEKTFVSIAGSALTDVAGFLALCVMDLAIGADIGIVMAKGVAIGLVGTVTILPAMILSLDKPIHRLSHKPLMFSFKATSRFVSKFAIPLAVVFLLLFVPAIYGKNHAKQDYDLSGGVPASLPSSVAGNKLMTEYGMSTSHYIVVRDDLPPAAIRDMIDKFSKVDGVNGVYAVEKYVGALIPEEFLPDSIKAIYKHGGKELMLVSSSYSTAMPEEMAQLDSIIAIVKSFDPNGLVTGESALSKDLVTVAANDFKHVDIVSIIAIFLIVLVAFTSLSIPIILVGSIELAIIMNLGIPFFLGQSISFLSTIVIGCIQLGVTIDYSILLVSRFKEELRTGLKTREAMQNAIQKAAPSILTSALILSTATGGVAFVSHFGLLKSICTLISRGALISMCVVLFLLPSLLILSEKVIAKTSLNWRKKAVPKAGSVDAP